MYYYHLLQFFYYRFFIIFFVKYSPLTQGIKFLTSKELTKNAYKQDVKNPYFYQFYFVMKHRFIDPEGICLPCMYAAVTLMVINTIWLFTIHYLIMKYMFGISENPYPGITFFLAFFLPFVFDFFMNDRDEFALYVKQFNKRRINKKEYWWRVRWKLIALVLPFASIYFAFLIGFTSAEESIANKSSHSKQIEKQYISSTVEFNLYYQVIHDNYNIKKRA
jgi:hypothetical protein